ncbi:hypothetical protein CFN16_07225 [Pseudomonas fluorescens]|uniref:Uncharacterized protein n=1 Tax=Pseudomonas fluorescens TaxID=294 RepID=A0A345UTY6_PSEFL|nr:hypothetical protein [Pseudomonas fluorescens]AXJ03938.1 hypothetical protein CFN16_07225 [Pseudomonas fluorescens]WJK11492.1 hypothetical protein QR290_09125 [Pseudomonas fluorescens]
MTALKKWVEECRQCAGLFRLGRDVEAALAMVDVFEGAQQSLVLAGAPTQLTWAQLLKQMLECQERQDWLGLADFMEYELIQLLEDPSA